MPSRDTLARRGIVLLLCGAAEQLMWIRVLLLIDDRHTRRTIDFRFDLLTIGRREDALKIQRGEMDEG